MTGRAARRVALVAAAVAALVVAPAAPAAAHTVTGVGPTDYRSEVVGIAPPVDGVTVRVLDLGRRVEVVNRSGRDLVVLGYDGDDYLWLRPGRGVYENTRSPSVALNRAGATTSTT